MPLIGCLDLLLADVDQAFARFSSSSDENLRDWLNDYPGDKLEALCIYCKNWLENDVLVGYRDIDTKEIDLDAWFEDREIQEFIEKLEKKSNKNTIKSRLQNQAKAFKDSLSKSNEDSENSIDKEDERRLPWPGGIKEQDEKFAIQEEGSNNEKLKSKPIDFYKFLIERIAEIKFSFGEFLVKKGIFNKSSYKTYFFAFLILFSFGIGIGFFRNNFKKEVQNEKGSDKPLVNSEENNKSLEKNISDPIKRESSINPNEITTKESENDSFIVKEINKASPSVEEIKNLIDTWLINKSNYLAGKGELNLSKIAKNGLIKRTIKERQADIEKGIYKNINSEILEISITSQTSSRIVALVELNYLEKTLSNSGEIINESSLSPLKVKYILGFSKKSWKLADFISGI